MRCNKNRGRFCKFNVFFDDTLRYHGITNVDLAEVAGLHPDGISKIRNSRRYPLLKNFWDLLQAMDYLHPGSLEYYGCLIAGREPSKLVEDLVEQLDPEDLAFYLPTADLIEFSNAINARIRGIPTFRYNYIDTCSDGDLYFITRSLIARLAKANKLNYLVRTIEDKEVLYQLSLLLTKELVDNSRRQDEEIEEIKPIISI